MSYLDNRTPFAADRFLLPDAEGQEVWLVVVSAVLSAYKGVVEIAERQVPVRLVDVHFGAPGTSSVRYEADLALTKPRVDLLVNAWAYAPRGRPVGVLPIELEVGNYHKRLHVHGDRFWRLGFRGKHPSSPSPFLKMPIIYERSYGGVEAGSGQADLRNPIGIGFCGAPSHDPAVQTELPNIGYPNSLLTSPSESVPPAGLGVVARSWHPRLGHAGRFDDAWLRDEWPLLPREFSSAHYQAAPADQQLPALQGGEQVTLRNLSPDGLWSFALPRLCVPVHLFYADRRTTLELISDTVLLEPEDHRVTLTGRVAIAAMRNRAPLVEIVLGHLTPGWLRARDRRKTFLDWRGDSGNDRGKRLLLS